MRPSGAHTHPGMGGGGGLALIVLAVILAAAIVEPVIHAVTSVLHVVVELLEVIAIVVGSLVGIAAAAGLVYLIARLRDHYVAHAGSVAYRPTFRLRQHGASNQVPATGDHPAIRSTDAQVYDITVLGNRKRQRETADQPTDE